MSRAYSQDLRERIVGHIIAGKSCRSAARYFGVSDSTAIRLGAAYRECGSVEPKVRGRPKGGGKLAPFVDFLVEMVEANKDITLHELASALLEEHGVSAHPSSIWRAIQAAGFTYKKIRYGVRVWTRGYPQGA